MGEKNPRLTRLEDSKHSSIESRMEKDTPHYDASVDKILLNALCGRINQLIVNYFLTLVDLSDKNPS